MVFYRKYRPQTIEELDSKEVRDKLTSILSKDSSFHALLFTGPKGLGKTSAARIVAKAVNCEKINDYSKGKKLTPIKSGLKKTLEPCNKCSACISITNGTNIDILEIDGASNRGIDEIRDLREKIKLSPANALKKVYIIDEVHMLTTEAFNALLKTLEEPPSHVIFILCTTEPHKVPATIASRCFHVSFKKATAEELARAFLRIAKREKISVEKDALFKISEFSDGSFRDGVKILEEIATDARNKKITKEMVEKIYKVTNIDHQIDRMIEFLCEKNVKEAMLMVGKVTEEGSDIKYFMEKLMLKLHELMLIEVGISKEKTDIDLNIEDIKTLMDLLTKAHGKLKYSVLPQLPLEIAIIEWSVVNAEGTDSLPHIENDAHTPVSKIQSQSRSLSERRQPNKTNSEDKPKSAFSSFSSGQNLSAPENKLWQRLIDGVKNQNHSIAGVLRGCSLKSYDGKKLVIEAKFKFHKEKLEDLKTKTIIEDVLKEITGKRISASFVLKS